MRRVDQQRIALCDGVGQRDVSDLEGTNLETPVVFFDLMQLDFAKQARFLELAPHQFHRERRRIDRHAEIGCEVWHGADVIFMRMGENDSFKLLRPLLDEFEVGEHKVHPGILAARESHAQIDHQPLAVAAVEVDVHPDLARAAEREKQQFVFGGEVLFQAEALSASMARPSRVRSLSTSSNRSVISSNRRASPPVATTLAGRPIWRRMRSTRPSIRAT